VAIHLDNLVPLFQIPLCVESMQMLGLCRFLPLLDL
jgi:hypothetical protein